MTASNEPLRLIQIGTGAMGRAWMEVVAASTEVELVGLVDLDVAAAGQAARAAGIDAVPVAASLQRLLEVVEAAAVLNVTVPAAHAGVTVDALLLGLPVLGEKPLADSVSAGLAMVAASRISGKLMMVSQSRGYGRQQADLRRQVAQLGTLGSVSCIFRRAPHFGGFRETMAFPLLVDMAIHQFDLARNLIGSDPVSVYCDSYNPPWSWYAGDAAAQVLVEFEDGVRFNFDGSWCSPGLETSWNGSWRVSAGGGSACWDGDNAPMAADGDSQPVVVGLRGPTVEPEDIAGALAEFVASVRSDGVPAGAAHRNILSLAMVEAATISSSRGEAVPIAEVLRNALDEARSTELQPEVLDELNRWDSVHDAVGRRPSWPRPASG